MPTETARETEDSSYSDNLLLDALKQLTDASYQGANATYAYFNKQFHDLCDYAEYLDKNKHVYWLYGGPDGFVLAYSLLKYIPDLIYNGSKTKTAKALRDFICNPWGSAIVITLLAASTITSAYANYMGKDKNNPDAQAFYVSWQAFRDGAKGARNANRGIRSTIDAIRLFSSFDMHYALLPLSLIIGIPSMYNRWWNRHMVTIRKKTLDTNESLTKELLNWGEFNQELTYLPESQKELEKKHANSYLLIDKDNFMNRTLYYINRNGEAEDLRLSPDEIYQLLEKQKKLKHSIDRHHPNLMQWRTLLPNHADRHFKAFSAQVSRDLNVNLDQENTNHEHNNRFRCNLSAGFDGFTSGLYLFIGLISLVSLTPEILTTVTVLSALSVVACIFTRMQEEREFDRLLRISEEKARLISCIRTLQAELAEAAFLKKNLDIPLDNNHSYENATLEQRRDRDRFLAADARSDETYATVLIVHEKLHDISSISDEEAALIGLKHGLIAHGSIVCGIFALSLISKVFFATALSQTFIAVCVTLSLTLTLISIATVVYAAAQHRKEQEANAAKQIKAVNELIQTIKGCHDASVLSSIENETAFSNLSHGTSLLNWTFLSWLEVLRSTGSGIMKGPKSVDFILLTFFDASSHHDHQHDSPVLTLLLIVALILCAIIWTLRALAKYAAKLREKQPKQAGTIDQDHVVLGQEPDWNLELDLPMNNRDPMDDLTQGLDFDQNPNAFDSPKQREREYGEFNLNGDLSKDLSEDLSSDNIRRGLSLGEGLDQKAPQTSSPSSHRKLNLFPEEQPIRNRPASALGTTSSTNLTTIVETQPVFH